MNSKSIPAAARRIRVRGHVQGVYFRASTAEHARRLELRGYAENRPDGSVLVHAAGDGGALEQLIEWLHSGPPMARVTAVDVEAIEAASIDWPPGFQAR